MNLRSLRKLPILYRPLSFLRRTGGRAWMRTMRRVRGIQKNSVLFTSFKGRSYCDSPRYISEALHALRPDIDIAWQIANPADVPDYVRPVKPHSLAALTELATARCFVDNFNRPFYLEKYPGVRDYLRDTVAAARETGYVSTVFGRRRRIPELSSSNKNLQAFGERVAMNSPIQGSAADIIKIAMINVSRRLKSELPEARLLLQVHDELLVEAPEGLIGDAARILEEEMSKAVSLAVPLPAECGTGDNWFICH